MGFFSFFKKKKVELSEKEQKWNKMWDLWTEEQIPPPYLQLMTYQSEVNNGGHDQYFTNVEGTADLQMELSLLETVLPEVHKSNLQKAYKAYLTLQENDDERAEEVLEQCDDVFYKHESDINDILEEYAEKIVL